MKDRRRTVFVFALALALLVALAPQLEAQVSKVAARPNEARSVPAFGSNAPNLLQWDDGTFETGLGVSGAAGYDGQLGMRFGGSPTTTALVPMRLDGVYWRMFSGFTGATNVNVNLWTNFAGVFPTNLVTQVAGNTNTSATQYVAVPGSHTVSTANGSVMAAVGVLGNSSWFVAGDNSGPLNQRQFFGAFTTTAWGYGPGTLSGYGLGMNLLIRLLVDGNIPVELESFSID